MHDGAIRVVRYAVVCAEHDTLLLVLLVAAPFYKQSSGEQYP
jgi:hypothetical protein